MTMKDTFILTFAFIGAFIANALVCIGPLWLILAVPLDILIIVFSFVFSYYGHKEKKNKKPDYRGTTDFHSWGRKPRFKK